MKSKKPGYRAGGPASRVRPRTPARRVAGKPTPLQTEQMRAAATLASKQAASKKRATLAQRKRMMAANERAKTGTMTLADRGYTTPRARAQARAAAANKQNPTRARAANQPLSYNEEMEAKFKKANPAQRKRMTDERKKAISASRAANAKAVSVAKDRAVNKEIAANLERRFRADLNRARAKAEAANKQNPNLDIKPNTGKTSAQRKKLFDGLNRRAMAAQRKKSFNAARSKAMGEYNAVTRSAAPPKSVRSEPVTRAQMAAQRKQVNAANSMAADKFNANAKNKSTPKAKSAIHGSLEAFTAAAAASTKNRSTPKAKLEPQTPRQTLNKRKAPTKPNTIGRGQVNKRFKGITSNVKRGNIDR